MKNNNNEQGLWFESHYYENVLNLICKLCENEIRSVPLVYYTDLGSLGI